MLVCRGSLACAVDLGPGRHASSRTRVRGMLRRMRYLIVTFCFLALACGSSQSESPMSPRPNAQQAEPPTATSPSPSPSPSPSNGDKPEGEPAEPSMQTPPSTPPRTTRDASMPQMQPQQPPSQPTAAAPKTNCNADTDCEAVDDMCGMCRCLPLAKGAERPVCQGTKVQCIMAPCRGKRPVCVNNTCSLLDAAGGAM
jgi:hypothetical protein